MIPELQDLVSNLYEALTSDMNVRYAAWLMFVGSACAALMSINYEGNDDDEMDVW